MKSFAIAARIAMALPFLAASTAPATPAEPTILDTGAALYSRACASCHGAHLEGAMGTPLTGAAFLESWNAKPARALYSRIISTMPLGNPGSLKEQQALAVTAYIASQNGVRLDPTAVKAANDLNSLAFSPASSP